MRPMNQSVLSRLNLLIDEESLTEKEMAERAGIRTGCKDKSGLLKMAKLLNGLKKNYADVIAAGGICRIPGIRGLGARMDGKRGFGRRIEKHSDQQNDRSGGHSDRNPGIGKNDDEMPGSIEMESRKGEKMKQENRNLTDQRFFQGRMVP